MDEAVAGLEAIAADPLKHREAAYAVAADYLSPEKVLPPMIEAIYARSS
jgi:hypothetical protein